MSLTAFATLSAGSMTVTVAEVESPVRSNTAPADVGLFPSVRNHAVSAVLVSAVPATLPGRSRTSDVYVSVRRRGFGEASRSPVKKPYFVPVAWGAGVSCVIDTPGQVSDVTVSTHANVTLLGAPSPSGTVSITAASKKFVVAGITTWIVYVDVWPMVRSGVSTLLRTAAPTTVTDDGSAMV